MLWKNKTLSRDWKGDGDDLINPPYMIVDYFSLAATDYLSHGNKTK